MKKRKKGKITKIDSCIKDLDEDRYCDNQEDSNVDLTNDDDL